MNEPEVNQELLEFFKALSDANRLKIIGLLAEDPCSVESLAALLELSASTTSHHLSKLAKAGLVSAYPDGHYYMYVLDVDALQDMAKRLLATEELPRLAAGADLEAYDRKVMNAFVDAEGRIKALPAQEKKFQVLLRYVLKSFEPGVHYTEKQVNETLARFNEDTASLRRGLIEYRLMEREPGGKAYWRTEEKD